MELATIGFFRAKWTSKIHDEWIENLLINRPDISREQLYRTRDLMNSAVMDSIVVEYESLIDALHLPDAEDRHVLAAAIHCSADAIITFNLSDFPEVELKKYNLEAQHPDEFIFQQFGLDHARMIIAARIVRARLKNPVKSPEAFLETLRLQQLPKTVAALAPYLGVI